MNDVTKTPTGKVTVDTSAFTFVRESQRLVLERRKLVNGLQDDIISKGYAIADEEHVRIYSPSFRRYHVDFQSNTNGIKFAILQDTSKTSKTIAESGVPLFRLLRSGAEIKAELYKENDKNIWTMEVFGEKNLNDMKKLAEELATKHKIDINVVGVAKSEKEIYFHPAADSGL